MNNVPGIVANFAKRFEDDLEDAAHLRSLYFSLFVLVDGYQQCFGAVAILGEEFPNIRCVFHHSSVMS
ncbi:hypothetical protein Gasu2_40540 [Galdieria sulphuraria]|nr:hypothetical protein Gasu2_40540 [Galdieria sulphuraria]